MIHYTNIRFRAAAAVLSMALAMTGCHKEENPGSPTAPQPVRADTPRYVAAHEGKIYVSCYNPPSVVRIDTATLEVEAQCLLGRFQPEGMAVAGGKLVVASSWIADETGAALYDNKVYIVDLGTFSVATTVEVGLNPQTVKAVDATHVVVNSNGDYGSTPAATTLINLADLTTRDAGVGLTAMDTHEGLVYGYNAPCGAAAVRFLCLDPTTLQTTPLLEGAAIASPYGINAIGGDLYVCTGVYNANGDARRYRTDGSLVWSREAGVFPAKVEPLGDGTAYVLNQGSWGSSNASLDRIDLATGTATTRVFSAANGRDLGDVAQDVVAYGSRAYVAVSFSNTVEAVSVKDNRSVQIAL